MGDDVMDPVEVTAFSCESCEEVTEPEDVGGPLYECSVDGTMFTAENSPNGNHQCPECNRFAAKIAALSCPSCEEGEVTEVSVWQVTTEHGDVHAYTREEVIHAAEESVESHRPENVTAREREREETRMTWQEEYRREREVADRFWDDHQEEITRALTYCAETEEEQSSSAFIIRSGRDCSGIGVSRDVLIRLCVLAATRISP